MFFTTHLAPNVMIGPTIASGVILNPKHVRKYTALKVSRHSSQVVVPWCDTGFTE